MRLPLHARLGRVLAATGLTAALLLPGVAPVAAQESKVLTVGTTQSLDSLNPYGTALVVGYEAFLLTYDMLVGFDKDIAPMAGFATEWQRAADGQSWTFKFRDDLLWSDGTPATAQDACFSYQINLDAIAAEANIGLGYIDPSVADSGITKVECPDDTTMIVTTSDASDRVLQNYVPILPKHIWGDKDYVAIGEDQFNAPLVGTGPYVATEWKTGEYVRFVRNPNYWGTQGAADEVIIRFFGTADTMVQALQAGEIDYARGVNANQFDALQGVENIATVNGTANGWTQLGFNTYGTGTGNVIEGGGPSTKALLDPAFRDALGYAVDKDALLDRILGGYGTVGTTNIPPALVQWHTPPAAPRTFDLALADQKLTAAGYVKDGANRLDKEGNPISLRLVMPDSDDTYPDVAEFIASWWGELGIKVNAQTYDEGTLIDLMLPPEAGGEANKADYDLFIWGWSGSPDPNALLQIFRCDAIGGSSDSNWCNPEFDALYDQQLAAQTNEERKPLLDQMQELFYTEAPYHILYYDANTDAYRTDRFGGWQNQPSNGTPLFAYSTLGYTLLTDAAAPTEAPSASAEAPTDGASAAPATPAPSGDGGGEGGAASDNTPLLIGGVVVVALVVVGLVLARRRGSSDDDE